MLLVPKSLRARVVVLVVLPALPALALSFRSAAERRKDAKEAIHSQAVRLVELAADTHARELLETEELERVIAEMPQLHEGSSECSSLLSSLTRGFAEIGDMAVWNQDGTLRCSASPSPEGTVWSAPPWVLQALRTRSHVTTYAAPVVGENPELLVASPIFDREGKVVGLLSAALQVGWLDSLAAFARAPRSARFVVMDRSGGVLARYPDPEGFIGQRFGDSPLCRAVTASRSGVLEVPGLDGVLRLSAFVPLPGTPRPELYAIYGIPKKEAFSEIDADLWQELFAIGLVTATALLLAWWGSRAVLLQPISRMATAAQHIRGGEFAARSEVRGEDEIGQLGVALDEMAAGLEARDAQRLRFEERIRSLNLALAGRINDLSEANRELESFSYTVSHDLRAPLRGIDGFARILEEEHTGDLSPEARRYLTRVRENAQQMGRLIDALLAFSRLGRQEIKRRTVHMYPLVCEIVEELKREESHRSVDVSIASDLPDAFGDPILVRQVLANLLSNAFKYTRSSIAAEIGVSWREGDEGVTYVVADNGVGFDPAYADSLFGVFQRLHRAEEYEGTGVGLASVQRIVHRHGGRVWAEAAPGKGATFYFTLGGGDDAGERA